MIVKKVSFEYPYFNIPETTGERAIDLTDTQLQEIALVNNTPIKIWLDVQQNTFEIKMYRTLNNEDTVYLWHKIDLQALSIKPGFVDQTAWVANLETLKTELDYIREYNITDVFAETVISKPYTILSAKVVSPYVIFVPDSSDSRGFLSFNYRIIMDPSTQYVVEGPSAASFVDENITIRDFVSPITLSSAQSSVTADGSITVNVSTDTFIDEVYLEQVYGLLNKTRVKLTNGQGSFILYATGLESGDTVRVKAGHKKFTGIADFTAPVV